LKSVMKFSVVCWYGYASKVQKKSVRKVVIMVSNLLGNTSHSHEKKANNIVSDKRHPLAFLVLLCFVCQFMMPVNIAEKTLSLRGQIKTNVHYCSKSLMLTKTSFA